ncbi:MAG: chemotaxis-specific protein-glutamate methyltransferase CheB [Elusimicrobiota bacterium]
MINVLVVDDSKFIQKIVTGIINSASDMKVVGVASTGVEALHKISDLKPDVVTLDIEMYPMDGLTVLSKIMENFPTPVIFFSGVSNRTINVSLEALSIGAVDFVPKPGKDSLTGMKAGFSQIKEELLKKIRVASKVDKEKLSSIYEEFKQEFKVEEAPKVTGKIVGIGASTGGPQALTEIITKLPEKIGSPVLVSQHMPSFFLDCFVERLNKKTKIMVKVAEDGEKIKPDVVLFAPSESNLTVEKEYKNLKTTFNNEKYSSYTHTPCIDAMIKSIAKIGGENSIGVLLSGMGRDGVDGLKLVKKMGGKTIVQDEKTSIVFGMPKKAIEEKVADKVLPLNRISGEIMKLIEDKNE